VTSENGNSRVNVASSQQWRMIG